MRIRILPKHHHTMGRTGWAWFLLLYGRLPLAHGFPGQPLPSASLSRHCGGGIAFWVSFKWIVHKSRTHTGPGQLIQLQFQDNNGPYNRGFARGGSGALELGLELCGTTTEGWAAGKAAQILIKKSNKTTQQSPSGNWTAAQWGEIRRIMFICRAN